MTDKKNEVDELPSAVNYVNTVAKLYADYSKAKTESEKTMQKQDLSSIK